MAEHSSGARPPLIGLVDETIRLNGRLRSVFAKSRAGCPLNDCEQMVLSAVIEAKDPPTTAKIGRSLGHSKQLIQRAANSLRNAGLITTSEHPDQKRTILLIPTEAGIKLKREIDVRADALAMQLVPNLDPELVRGVSNALRVLRREIEIQLKSTSRTSQNK